MADSEAISKVLYTSKQPKRNKIYTACVIYTKNNSSAQYLSEWWTFTSTFTLVNNWSVLLQFLSWEVIALLQFLCCHLLQSSPKRASWRLLTNILHVIHRYTSFLKSLSKLFEWTNVKKVFEGLFIAGPYTKKRSKFSSFHWSMLILFNLFVTFLFNTVENKKDKIAPTLRTSRNSQV